MFSHVLYVVYPFMLYATMTIDKFLSFVALSNISLLLSISFALLSSNKQAGLGSFPLFPRVPLLSICCMSIKFLILISLKVELTQSGYNNMYLFRFSLT